MSALPILVNGAGGTARRLGRRGLKALAGADDDLRILAPDQLPAAMAELAAAGHQRIAVGGGDGTLSLAAGCAIRHGLALAPLPLGTRNHLIRDLGLPLDPRDALVVARTGVVRRIDVGRVGDRVFVNNLSLGFYPWMVARREAASRRTGWPRWLALLRAAQLAMRRFPRISVTLETGEQQRTLRTPLLFVGNNRYGDRPPAGLGWLPLPGPGRARLDAGRLHLVTTAELDRATLIRIAASVLRGEAFDLPGVESLQPSGVRISTRRRRSLRVAIDGEVIRMRTPLEIRSDPGALAVVVAADPPGQSSAGSQSGWSTENRVPSMR